MKIATYTTEKKIGCIIILYCIKMHSMSIYYVFLSLYNKIYICNKYFYRYITNNNKIKYLYGNEQKKNPHEYE